MGYHNTVSAHYINLFTLYIKIQNFIGTNGNNRFHKLLKPVIYALCSAAVLFFAVAVWFALVWSGSARLDEDLAAAVERRQELSETIERKNLILENEISNRVICQVAEEKLYMQRPAAVKTVSIYLPQRTGSQTAGR